MIDSPLIPPVPTTPTTSPVQKVGPGQTGRQPERSPAAGTVASDNKRVGSISGLDDALVTPREELVPLNILKDDLLLQTEWAWRKLLVESLTGEGSPEPSPQATPGASTNPPVPSGTEPSFGAGATASASSNTSAQPAAQAVPTTSQAPDGGSPIPVESVLQAFEPLDFASLASPGTPAAVAGATTADTIAQASALVVSPDPASTDAVDPAPQTVFQADSVGTGQPLNGPTPVQRQDSSAPEAQSVGAQAVASEAQSVGARAVASEAQGGARGSATPTKSDTVSGTAAGRAVQTGQPQSVPTGSMPSISSHGSRNQGQTNPGEWSPPSAGSQPSVSPGAGASVPAMAQTSGQVQKAVEALWSSLSQLAEGTSHAAEDVWPGTVPPHRLVPFSDVGRTVSPSGLTNQVKDWVMLDRFVSGVRSDTLPWTGSGVFLVPHGVPGDPPRALKWKAQRESRVSGQGLMVHRLRIQFEVNHHPAAITVIAAKPTIAVHLETNSNQLTQRFVGDAASIQGVIKQLGWDITHWSAGAMEVNRTDAT